jgi:uncharacterized protein DUF6496
MPDKTTVQRAERDRREGKAPSTQAGEFVREEIEHVREGKHGARSARQAIAIGLSKARRAGVEMPPPRTGSTSRRTRRQAARDTRGASRAVSTRRSRATLRALTKEGRAAGSRAALSRQARGAAARRSPKSRSGAARRAAATRKRAAR